jgi:hypothetical protein
VDPEDMFEAKRRGEIFADDLVRGYKDAVSGGDYRPSRSVKNGIDAADLSDAGMQGKLKLSDGWSSEGIFPYKDTISQLSNPPALLRVPPEDLDYAIQLAESARNQRALNRVRSAVKTGVSATADLAGSVPLFDPEFRQAVESGDARKAGAKLAQEYATGAVAAPVAGAGAGALQRVAPRAAATVLPGLAGAVRVGNPVAVVSQLGGSSKPSQQQMAEEKRRDPVSFGAQGPSANSQLLRAEAARRRGGKWKIGPFTVPELGISEAGGLFFR